MVVLLAGAFALVYYFHAVLGFGAVFTHLFYVPIILASLWWKRKGLIVAVVLAAGLIASDLLPGVHLERADDYLRAVMFVGVSMTAAILSERIAKKEKSLLNNQRRLQRLALELTSAEERERRRIAEGLHDHVGQNLLVSKMKLQALREKLADTEYPGHLDELVDMAEQSIQDIRSAAFTLSPGTLAELGFVAAAAGLVDQWGKTHGITCDFQDDGSLKPLDDDVQAALFRALRELLLNVSKHSQASKVSVKTLRADGEIKLSVEDNGTGFGVSAAGEVRAEGEGFGLFSIRERLRLLGGSVAIRSAPGQGACITICAPLSTIGDNATKE